jgi:hypothetical protein
LEHDGGRRRVATPRRRYVFGAGFLFCFGFFGSLRCLSRLAMAASVLNDDR